MKKISLIKGMSLCRDYQRMNALEREAVRAQRLNDIITWAREQSPIYKELYKDIKEVHSLSDLPVVTKAQLMPQFDRWITDSDVCLSEIEAFMQNKDNIGRKFHNKYLVFTTSGSTGEPLVTLCDKTSNSIMGAIGTLRSFTRKKDMRTFVKRGGKSIGVFATGGFYLSNSSVRARQLTMPWKKNKIDVTSALLPIDEIVEQLNRFQPAMLGGYPTNLEMLIEEQISGRLHINPVLIMTGGEFLSDQVRESLKQAFGCYVQTSYSTTEGGIVACECSERHFHINDDWLIVEPVDSNNQPVEDGVQSDKILLTNLFNYTQPFIHYEITDRIVMHHEPCPCGNQSPWLTIEGRTDDVVEFTDADGKEVRIPPLTIYAVLKEVHEIRRFQVIVHPRNQVELRLEPIDGASKEGVCQQAGEVLLAFLARHNINTVNIKLSDELPKQHPGSGKFKHVINQKEV